MPYIHNGVAINIVIPARYASTRFPGKPLIDLCGVSMIHRVWKTCAEVVGRDSCFIATDDDRIANHCLERDLPYLMTSADCLTGTDRVAEAAGQLDGDLVINVQGDEPLISADDLRTVINAASLNQDAIINAACEIFEEREFRSLTVPKVVFNSLKELMYISRSPIPISKGGKFVLGYKQVCIYSFPRKALEVFAAANGKTELESIEDIEILRFLEMGFKVSVVKVSSSSVAVDTPEDADRVRELISSEK